ncbi:hypothetical protein G7Y89_g6243 [Cudoniella acicularis]|uniref:Transcription factor domain-containing protein n=1 Tax=Cudoniella acicularis TaxID=354080 RepID=A0A8H4RN43_9HELO|nr:hypothetical protein G7Y89_g6243 [Cudoniella acicularis]
MENTLKADGMNPSAPSFSNDHETSTILRAVFLALERRQSVSKVCERPSALVKAQPRKRRHPEKSYLSKSRVEKLEEKLDDLVNLLTTSHEVGPREAPSRSTSAKPADGNGNSVNQASESTASSPDQARLWDNRLLIGGPLEIRFGLPPESAKDIKARLETMGKETPIYRLPHIDLGSEDAGHLLHIFRDEMNPNFPFISIPDSVTASELRRDRPSLYTSVMAVTSRNSSQQISLGKLFMKQVANRMVVDGERNIDLLLGILTFSAWCCRHFSNIPGFTVLLTSASTLVGDLGLHRPPAKQTERTLEERRALLGYYCIHSIISTFFRRLEPPRWTPYHDDCCEILSNAGVHRDDKYAVALLKIQLLGEKICQSPWHDVSDTSTTAAPPILYMKGLQEQSKDVERSTIFEQQNNVSVLLSYQNTNVVLYKFGLSKSSALSMFTFREFNRLEYLYTCLQAVKSFFDTWLTMPISRLHTYSIPMSCQVTWNLGILQLLSTFEHPDWDLTWVKETIDFTELLGKLAGRFNQGKEVLGMDAYTTDRVDIYSHIGRIFAWMKTYFEGQPGHNHNNFDLSNAGGFVDFDFLNDVWMGDTFGPWEYQSVQ